MIVNKNALQVRTAWVALAVTLILGAAVTFIVYSISHITQGYTTNLTFSRVLVLANQARHAEKNFLAEECNTENFCSTGRSEFFLKNQSFLHEADSLISLLKANPVCAQLHLIPQLNSLQHELGQYENTFLRIGNYYRQRGFRDVGLEGKMRDAIHAIESSRFLDDKTYMLSLRRDEKNFFLRKDLKHLDEFRADMHLFKAGLSRQLVINTSDSAAQKGQEISAALAIYEQSFSQIVNIEKQVGLNEKAGLKGELNAISQLIQQQLEQLQQPLYRYAEARSQRAIVTVLALFGAIVGLMILGIYYFSRVIFSPIRKLEELAYSIAGGNVEVSVDASQYNSLLQGLVRAFEQMLGKLKETMRHLDGISRGDLNTPIQKASDADMLSTSLINMTNQLKAMRQEEEIRNWLNSGLTHFANILRENRQSQAMSQLLLSELVKYVKASQGMLLIDHNNHDELEVVACYAFDRRKYLQKRIPKGNGLAGRCWLESQTIYLTDVPENYVFITSGLGDANPRTILLVPLKYNGQTEGVLELASFRTFAPHEITFLEKVCESAAATFNHQRMMQQLNQPQEKTLQEYTLQG